MKYNQQRDSYSANRFCYIFVDIVPIGCFAKIFVFGYLNCLAFLKIDNQYLKRKQVKIKINFLNELTVM